MMFTRVLASLGSRRKSIALAALSGVLYFVGFCGFDQFYLSWICLVPVLWALDDETLKPLEVVFIAWLFGLVTHLGGYTWITGMLRDFGHLPVGLAILGYFLLCLGQATLLAAWGIATHWLVARKHLNVVWVAPVVMVLCEWLWPALFPSYLSNSQYRQSLVIQSLDLWGPLGVTFILVICSAVVYQTLRWRISGRGKAPIASWVALGALAFGNALYGYAARANTDDTVAEVERRIRVATVQTSMGIYEKHEDPEEGLRRHRQQSLEVEAQGAQLIVWPESGFNRAIPAGVTNVAQAVLGKIETPLLFGGLRVEGRGASRRLFNTAFLTDASGNILGTYDKTYLLAFGEYIPLGDLFPWLYDLEVTRYASHFHRGTHTHPLVLDGIRYGVLICYEDILPAFVRKVMQNNPHVLVNMTNDAWFGRSREPVIHLALSIFRAVEHRRFLVRSTNTGISAIVDPVGRILEQTPLFARANLVHDITPLEGRTLYGLLGDWIGFLCLAVLLAWVRRDLHALLKRILLGRVRRKGR